MGKILLFWTVFLTFSSQAVAQDDSIPPPLPDTTVLAPVVRRTVPRKPFVRKKDSVSLKDSLTIAGNHRLPMITEPLAFSDTFIFAHHPFYRFTNPVHYPVSLRKWEGKEAIFYSIILLLLYFALIRNGFARYISDLFKIFFQTSVNQKQIRDQLVQSPLPSLLLNVFFLLSTGMFATILLQYAGMGGDYNFWILFLYCILGLAVIYTIKFISLKLVGWIFQVSEAANAYIFIVFTTNKILAIALLPFLVVLAFTYGFITQAAMNLAILVVVVLFAYRYFLSYVSIHRQIRINFFHFLLYLLAFELVPLLLINKLLFSLLGERY